MANERAKTERTLGMVGLGLSVNAALAAAAADEQTTPEDVVRAVRHHRFLILHARDYRLHQEGRAHDHIKALLDALPVDVIPFPVDATPGSEAQRDRLLSAMGIGLSALPSIVAWRDSYDEPGEDDDGNPITITHPPAWECVPIRTREDCAWDMEAPPLDRRSPARGWCKRFLGPPPPEDT